MSQDSSRRQFIRDLAAAGTLGVGATLGLTACGGGDDDDDDPPTNVAPGVTVLGDVEFRHGVASGDPLADRVMLWTRAVPGSERGVELRWQVASDSAFSNVVASGTAGTGAASDYTVKVDATGLVAGTAYFYRFSSGGKQSPTGRTRTLPEAGAARVKLAVFSCANYPAGYFNVYAEAARIGDLDATVHLGDYIYEYSATGYASQSAAALGRVSDPANEIVTLADYRRRYAQYRSDVDLQAVHAAAPMIVVWDDHELANDSYAGGAQNHDSATEGAFAARRAAAFQAWAEWLPVRLPDASRPDLIYRSFDFGNLLSLHMLDTRNVARDRQLSYTNYIGASGLDTDRFAVDMVDAGRQLLGTVQSGWLTTQLTQSSATWQVLGQQVLMGRMNVPAPLVTFQVSVAEYAAIAAKAATAPATLTLRERAILAQPSIPYNLDAWDGYAPAREAVLGTAKALGKNLISLAGDTHNAWASDLLDASGAAVGVEFATPSVTSPGFESIFVDEEPKAFAATLAQLIAPLVYTDTSQRGFMVLTVTANEARADWVFVSTISSRAYTASTQRSLKTLPGRANRKIVDI